MGRSRVWQYRVSHAMLLCLCEIHISRGVLQSFMQTLRNILSVISDAITAHALNCEYSYCPKTQATRKTRHTNCRSGREWNHKYDIQANTQPLRLLWSIYILATFFFIIFFSIVVINKRPKSRTTAIISSLSNYDLSSVMRGHWSHFAQFEKFVPSCTIMWSNARGR